MTTIDDLADRYWTLFHDNDQAHALWEGDLDQLEGWDDYSQEAQSGYRADLLEISAEARGALSAAAGTDRLTLGTLDRSARAEAAGTETKAELMAHNPEIGMYGLMRTFLPAYTLVTADHGRRYLDKLRAAPAMLDGMGEALRRGRGRGWVPIRLHVEKMMGILDRDLAADLDGGRLGAQPPPVEDAPADWEATVRGIVGSDIRPALARYRGALEEVALPAARPDDMPGLCHLEDGEEVYGRCVAGYTTTDLTPAEVHQRGLEQVARLDGEYREMGADVFGTGDLDTIYARIRDDESLHYGDAESLVADATEMFRRAQAEAPAWFRRTPEADCEVRPTTSGAMAFYSGPGLESGKPAAFYFNVRDPSVWGPNLASTTFHEGIPGHHFDLARSLENVELREIHRRMYVAAFNEGWALYSERLSDEMGLYRTGIERLGMLMGDSLRACRLVVDTGMHALGWSRDEAIDYMLRNSPLPRGEIVPEIDRYIGNPGQACAYMIGRLEIDDARTSSQRRLGSGFELADFHEAVLGHGTLSLEAMRWAVDAWVESKA